MLARLLRLLVYSLIVLAAAGWQWATANDWPMASRIALVAVIAMPHACVLAAEFVLLRCLGQPQPAPPPTARQLIAAWAAEVLAGIVVFGWRQPFRSRSVQDRVDSSVNGGRRGVVLVHGYLCNRGFWLPWMRRLDALGVPFVAVDLEPVFGSIDDYPPLIERAVQQLERSTGLAPMVVAHSMGGLATRAWLRRYNADHRVAGVITIGTPHHGTWPARLAWTRNAREMRQHSRWIASLSAAETPSRRALFTCYFGHCDNIVFPAASATLPDATNVHLPGVAHVHMAGAPAVFDAMMARLGR